MPANVNIDDEQQVDQEIAIQNRKSVTGVGECVEAGLTASASEAAEMARNKETLVVLLDASVSMRPHLHVALHDVGSEEAAAFLNSQREALQEEPQDEIDEMELLLGEAI
ncbi:unnamed protein product [Sphagnum compactum]